jgi:hypothetical protein
MSLFLGIVKIELFLPHSDSLKAKRSVVNGLKERLKKLNASVAEVDGLDLWQRATLGLALVGGEARRVEETIGQARALIEREYRAEIVAYDWDVSPVS